MTKSKKTKTHKKIDGLLLQMNKTFSNLKMKQKDKITGWVYEEYKKYVTDHEKAPDSLADEQIVEAVLDKINEAQIWIPDGEKDKTVSRYEHRRLLQESLDEVLAEKISTEYLKDCVECKLFGIGSESYVVGSHEFYMGYAVKNNMTLTLDAGHYHPTEVISDKLSSMLLFVPEITLHVSRPERWDSDHVVILTDELLAISQEIVRSGHMDRIHMGLDYFDASINRIGAYVVGIRSAQKAMLQALLEPTEKLREYEKQDKNFERMAYLEELKGMPWNILYNYYCNKQGVPVGDAYIKEIQAYESEITSKRN